MSINQIFLYKDLKDFQQIFQDKINLNCGAIEDGQNTVSKVLGAECLDGDIQDHITN